MAATAGDRETKDPAVDVDVRPVPADAVADGDRFDRLYHELRPGLFGLTYRLVGDAGDTEEVVQ